ncbi:MAG: hypothetical protein GTO29_05715 [Candidatus Latescibacteria bacterium]|nr:hypothetical protein [Candidatus Latescibacterota bacterium]NIO55298.1 hypothetical protein [Candidatus Latescibacterota bacterium]
MKRTLLVALCMVLAASVAVAQPGTIGIFSDLTFTSNQLTDAGGPVFAYVAHINTSGSTGSRFMVVQANLACMTYVGETSPFATVMGNSQTGIEIAYGSCVVGSFEVLTIEYAGCSSPACAALVVMPDTAATPEAVLVTDCEVPPNLIVTSGGYAWINFDGTCTVPIEDTSWGRIKTLYR